MSPRGTGVALFSAWIALVGGATASAQGTWRVDVDSTGAQADGETTIAPRLSADGRFVVFTSKATDLVPGDSNGFSDVFVHDLQTGATERVSVSTFGAEGNGDCRSASISADGRFVAFASLARNLVPDTIYANINVYLRDRAAGTTELVSVDSSGFRLSYASQDPAISADGNCIAFMNGDNPKFVMDTFVRDRAAGTTTLANVDSSGVRSNDSSWHPAISSDGRFVTFDSTATNLVLGDNNHKSDVFVRDLQAGTTECASVDSSGVLGNGDSGWPSITDDGRSVAFSSFATNLVTGDFNVTADVFVHDRTSGATEISSVDSAGTQGDGASSFPSISADGKLVVFTSSATNLVSGDTNAAQDVFLHDRAVGTTSCASVDAAYAQGNGASGNGVLAGGGRFVAFTSVATNLVAGDTNGLSDVFVQDSGPYAPVVTSVTPDRMRYDATTNVTVHGRNFLLAPPPTVLFGTQTTSNVSVVDDATLTCTVPPGPPGPLTVSVQNANGIATLDGGFLDTPAVSWSGDATLGGAITIEYACDPLDGLLAIAGVPPVVSISTPPFDGALAITPFVVLFLMPPGIWTFDELGLAATIPNDPALSGATVLLQSLTGPSFHAPRDAAWTNCAEMTIH